LNSKLGPAEVWTSRQALQDLYQKMLVTDLEYALDKKVEQDLWNHAFKNQITTLQGQAKNRANPNRSEVQANLSLFLEAASGFYTQVSCKKFVGYGIFAQPGSKRASALCYLYLMCSKNCFLNSTELVPTTVLHLTRMVVPRVLFSVYSIQYLSGFLIKTPRLILSFLGVLCKCPLQNDYHEDSGAAYPLPAVKVSMDWLKLRPSVFQEAVVDERRYIWPWLISLLNSFQPHEEDLSSNNATPLPEEFELQGFLALRPSFRNLDFSKGHQAITGDKEGQQCRIRQQRLIFTGKWIADNQPRLIQCENEVGKLLFLTEIPELLLEDPSEAKENLALQEASIVEPLSTDGSPGLKSVLSSGRSLNNNCDSGEKPMVTFKENIKPREINREQGRIYPPKDVGRERRDYSKGIVVNKNDGKKDNNKRKNETKKCGLDKMPEAGKQNVAVQVKSQTEMRKTPVSEARKTPVTQTPSQASSSQFIPIHHPGAFPPLPSRPGFPPPTYVVPPPVAFSMSTGYTFPGGVSVPGTFLQPTAHSPAGNQVQGGKQSHIPYSQQRPSGPGPMTQGPQQTPPPSQQPLSSLPAQAAAQSASQLQAQALAQQQSPTKAVQGLGKSPPHHSGFQQYPQMDSSKQLWNPSQVQGSLGKIMPVKQSYYLQTQDPLKLFEQSLQPPVMQQQPLEKKMKPFPMEPYNQNPSEVKVPEYYWDSSYGMADNRVMAQQSNMERRGKRQGVFRPEQDAVSRMTFEDPKSSPLLPPDLLKSLAALEEEEELIFSNPPDLYPALLGPLASLPGRSLFKSLLEKPSELMSQSSSFLSLSGFSLNQERYPNNSMFNEVYGKNMNTSAKTEVTPSVAHQETSLYSLFEGTPWSPSLPASSDHSTPASQSPHSSNPSSLPSSPPTHNHNSVPFSNFGPIGTPDNRDRRVADRWKTDKPAMGGFGLDYLPATSSSSESSWHQTSTPSGTWAAQGPPAMEDSSAVLMESLKSIWSSSMMHPGPSALEQLLMQQKQKQQRGQSTMNPPH
uniref:Nonsense-mediated mRNA decay factor n=1 Tax=Amazona collaria TaxID=241587 RepID=A0A8B9F0I9_9PSIT